MSLYSPSENVFSDDHRRIVEAVARHITDTVAKAADYQNQRASVARDPATGLLRFEQLSRLIALDQPVDTEFASPVSLLFVELVIDHTAAASTLRSLVSTAIEAVRSNLRAADFVLLTPRHSSSSVDHNDFRVARTVADRISLRPDVANRTVNVGASTAPDDGSASQNC
jgi:GAF domain-containing protein